jgi:hypothetical protein
MERGEARRPVVKGEAVVLLTYVALTLVATYPLVLEFSHVVPAGGDSWLYYWDLWWVKRSLIEHAQNPFFTRELYFPYGASLYFHTLNLLPSALAVPIARGVGLAGAYNAIVLAGFVLTGYISYRLALDVFDDLLDRDVSSALTLRHDSELSGLSRQCAAFVAGVTYAFSSYRFAHLFAHLDLLQTWWLPLFALLFLRVRASARPGWIIAAGLCLAGTALTSWNYVFFLLPLMAVILVDTVVRQSDRWAVLRRVGWVFVTFGLVVSPVLIPMVLLGRTAGRASDPASDSIRFSPDLFAYLTPSYLHPIWGRRVEALYRLFGHESSGIERITFLGFVPLVLGSMAVAARSRSSRRWSIILAVYAALALGPVLRVAGYQVPGLSWWMPYRLLMRLPYGTIPRVPARLVSMASLSLSVLAGIGAQRVLNGHRARILLLTSLLSTLAIGENLVFPIPVQAVVAPSFFGRLAADHVRGGVLEVPIPDDPATFPQRMLWQTVHGQPVFGGYLSRGLPPILFEAVPGFAQLKTGTWQIDDVVTYDQNELAHIGRAVLAEYGAKHVLIEKAFLSSSDSERLRRVADATLGEAAMVYDDEIITAYHVAPPASPPPQTLWLDTGWSYLERSGESGTSGRARRWRWMTDNARLGVMSPRSATVRLQLSMRSFKRPRRVRFSIGERTVAVVNVGTTESPQETPAFGIGEGATYIDISSLDGSESGGVDPRRLSVAVFRLKLGGAGVP